MASGGIAVLLAAGRGARMAGAVADKILAPLGDRTVFRHSIDVFLRAAIVDRFIIVHRDEPQRAALERELALTSSTLPCTFVTGGAQRQDSVAAALRTLSVGNEDELVFIHDCARPLVRASSLQQLAAAARTDGAACLAHRVIDTIRCAPSGAAEPRRLRWRTLERDRLWAMETPQVFRSALIAGAYAKVQSRGLRITDDAQALELVTRHPVTLVENPHPNPKLTHPADFAWAELLLQSHPTVTPADRT